MAEPRLLLLAPIALMALAALICPKPSLSALLLLLESGLIAIFFGSDSQVAPAVLGPAILLCLFCLLPLVANIYIKKSIPKTTTTMPKLSIAFGLILFLFYTIYFDRLKNIQISSNYVNNLNLDAKYDSLSIICIIFTIFTIIISAFSIINIKNAEQAN